LTKTAVADGRSLAFVSPPQPAAAPPFRSRKCFGRTPLPSSLAATAAPRPA